MDKIHTASRRIWRKSLRVITRKTPAGWMFFRLILMMASKPRNLFKILKSRLRQCRFLMRRRLLLLKTCLLRRSQKKLGQSWNIGNWIRTRILLWFLLNLWAVPDLQRKARNCLLYSKRNLRRSKNLKCCPAKNWRTGCSQSWRTWRQPLNRMRWRNCCSSPLPIFRKREIRIWLGNSNKRSTNSLPVLLVIQLGWLISKVWSFPKSKTRFSR